MSELILLHISDAHIRDQSDLVLGNAEKIASAIRPYLPNASAVFLIFTGDIAYSGKKEEYDLAEKFINEIKKIIAIDFNGLIDLITVPGNHDCDFSCDNGARKALISQMDSESNMEIDSSIISICTSIQNNYFDFQVANENSSDIISDDRLCRVKKIDLNNKVIEVVGLNASWVSRLRENPGTLHFPVDNYSSIQNSCADIRLVIIHQPLNWFSQSVYRPFRRFVRTLADIVITGHEHEGNVGLIADAESNQSAFIEGCVLQENGKTLDESSFNIVQIDIDLDRFCSTRFIWSGDHYISTENGSWSSYRNLPQRVKSPLSIKDDFLDVINDPGGYFKHPTAQQISLSDLFVFPDLKDDSVDPDGDEVNVISAVELTDPEFIRGGLIVESEEKSGATSLLYQLFKSYHQKGFFPLYVKGKDLKRTQDDEIQSVLEKAISNQYQSANLELFLQQEKNKLLLILDNFDDCPVKNSSGQGKIISSLNKIFSSSIITVSPVFELQEILKSESAHCLNDFRRLVIQPFGYKKRTEIIQRWYSLGRDESESESVFIAKCDQAERAMNVVMRRSIIPSVPLYLLTLLQSLDADRAEDLRQSSLGHYYEFLLVQAFIASGIKQGLITEVFQYCSLLAWFFNKSGKREISEQELRSFNSEFSSEWTTVDFQERIDLLLRAKVLRRNGSEYSFWYPYVYYYLKGKYISDNLAVDSVRTYVSHCCNHLYVRDHANTILFLTHHTNDSFVVDAVAGSLRSCFSERKPIEFNGDTLGVKTLIVDASKLIYQGGSPSDHRIRQSELRDSTDDGRDGLSDFEEKDGVISLPARLTSLYKTMEILGQILKNQYSKIKRSRKTELIDDLFSAPLRALSDFYEALSVNPDRLIDDIEKALRRKGKDLSTENGRDLARKTASEIIQIITFSFITKTAQCSTSVSLQENIDEAVKKNNTMAFKLIELAIHLDSPGDLPRGKIQDFLQAGRNELIVTRQLQMLLLIRLYMFKTSEKDMQWLSSNAGFGLALQHRITYLNTKQRRLN